MSRDIPIIFSAPMVRALLDGRKTQTRRLLKPQPPKPEDFPGSVFGLSRAVADGVEMFSLNDYDRLPKHPTKWDLVGSVGVARGAGFPMEYNARYAAGDRLWVREKWQTGMTGDSPKIAYAATPDLVDIDAWDGPDEGIGPSFNYDRCPGAKWCDWLPDVLNNDGPWRPSIHMPHRASRLTLVVEGVKVERLQEISEEDARTEGVAICPNNSSPSKPYYLSAPDEDGSVISWPGARMAFQDLWDKLHGATAWDANPWVVALTFAVHKANIDSLSAALQQDRTPPRQDAGRTEALL